MRHRLDPPRTDGGADAEDRADRLCCTRTEPWRARSPTADVEVTVVGNTVLLRPLTRRASAWIAKNVQQKPERCCGALVMSLEYLEDVVTAMRNDGMTVV